MIRQVAVIFFIFLAVFCKDTASWQISIHPEAGHIRVNKSTRIICRTTEVIDECVIKIDDRETMNFSQASGTQVVINKKGMLYRASYAGTGLENGQCGVNLSNMAAGVYIVGCQMRKKGGSLRMSYMPLTVDNSQPLRVKVNRKYQVAAPGSDVEILCSTERRQPITTCALRLPSQQWVTFPKGHLSRETDRYHYHGRGLEKGHCGITLLNVGPDESGLYMCQVKAGEKSAVHAAVLKVARAKPETEISWNEKHHLYPGDSLDAECVMRGAYPLPPMVWTYESKVVQNSDIDETLVWGRELTWPWEDHVMRQKFFLFAGSKFGNTTLKCEPGEPEEEADLPGISKYIITTNNQIIVPIHPKCGMRTNSTYHMTNKRKPITKRHLSTKAGTQGTDTPNASDDHASTPVSNIGNPLPRSSTPKSKTGSTHGADDDYEEPVWDETDDVVTLESPRPHTSSIMYNPPALGMIGGFAVIGPEHFPLPPTTTPENHPAYIVGGKEVLIHPKRNSTGIDQLPAVAGGTAVKNEFHQSVGGTAVINYKRPDIEFHTFPWTAGVYRKVQEEFMQQCGGTLVTEKHVICAAHCFWDEIKSKPTPSTDYWVALGKVFRDWNRVDDSVQKRGVRHLHLHPGYRGRKRNYQHDIAVIELDSQVLYTPRVSPACLDWDNHFEERQLVNGNVGVVTGWGFTENDTASEVLRYVELPYVDPNACFDKLPETLQLLLTTDKFCAGFTNGNISVCQGDSGGGLLFQDKEFGAYFLRGVVSLSFKPPEFRGKCYYLEVSGFTSVSKSMDWLKKVMEGFVP